MLTFSASDSTRRVRFSERFPAIAHVAVIGLLLVAIAGFAYGWFSTPSHLHNLGTEDFSLVQFAQWCAIAAVVGGILPPAFGVIGLSVAAFVFLVAGVGSLQVASALWYGGAIFLGGRGVVAWLRQHKRAYSAELAWVYGIALFVAVFSVLVHFTVNYRLVDGLIVSIPYIFALRTLGSRAGRPFRMPKITRLTYWAFAVFMVAFVWCGTAAFVPSIAFDDLSFHQLLLTQLKFHHGLLFDVRSQIWSVAPFASDLLIDIPSHVVGRDMRGAIDLGLLTLVSWAAWRLLRWVHRGRAVRFVVLAVIVSTPLNVLLMTSRQVEMFGLAYAVMLTTLILRMRRASWIDVLVAGTALVMLAAATKLTLVILVVFMGLTFLALRFKYANRCAKWGDVPLRHVAIAMFVFAIAGMLPYVYAYLKTGDPVFPLYNAIFHSPYYPNENFTASLFSHRRSLSGFLDMFWHTSAYLEADDFTSGFQFVGGVLAGCIVMCFAGRRAAATRLAFVASLAFLVMMFCMTQYYRYVGPVVPMLCMPIAFLFPRRRKSAAMLAVGRSGLALVLCVAAIAGNVLVSPGVMYYLKPGWLQCLTARGKTDLITEIAPEIALNDRLSREEHGNASVLFDPNRPYYAALWGHPFSEIYYMPAVQAAMKDAQSPDAFRRLVEGWGVRYVYWDAARAYDESDGYLRRAGPLVGDYGYPIAQVGRMALVRLTPEKVATSPIANFAPPRVPDFSLSAAGAVKPDSDALFVSSASVATHAVSIGTARAVRYEAQFTCVSKDDYFIAQINWRVGAPYYRLVACTGAPQAFSDNVFVPEGNVDGLLYLSTRNAGGAKVSAVRLSRIERPSGI